MRTYIHTGRPSSSAKQSVTRMAFREWLSVPAYAEFSVASDKSLVHNPSYAFPRVLGAN